MFPTKTVHGEWEPRRARVSRRRGNDDPQTSGCSKVVAPWVLCEEEAQPALYVDIVGRKRPCAMNGKVPCSGMPAWRAGDAAGNLRARKRCRGKGVHALERNAIGYPTRGFASYDERVSRVGRSFLRAIRQGRREGGREGGIGRGGDGSCAQIYGRVLRERRSDQKAVLLGHLVSLHDVLLGFVEFLNHLQYY